MTRSTAFSHRVYALHRLERIVSPYRMLVARIRMIDYPIHELPLDSDRITDDAHEMVADLALLGTSHTNTYMQLGAVVEARLTAATCIRGRSFATQELDVLRINTVSAQI